MVRRLIRPRERVIEVAAFKKEDHRHAGTFGWHPPRQDKISSRGTWHCQQGACAEECNLKQLLAYTANMPASQIGLEAYTVFTNPARLDVKRQDSIGAAPRNPAV